MQLPGASSLPGCPVCTTAHRLARCLGWPHHHRT